MPSAVTKRPAAALGIRATRSAKTFARRSRGHRPRRNRTGDPPENTRSEEVGMTMDLRAEQGPRALLSAGAQTYELRA